MSLWGVAAYGRRHAHWLRVTGPTSHFYVFGKSAICSWRAIGTCILCRTCSWQVADVATGKADTLPAATGHGWVAPPETQLALGIQGTGRVGCAGNASLGGGFFVGWGWNWWPSSGDIYQGSRALGWVGPRIVGWFGVLRDGCSKSYGGIAGAAWSLWVGLQKLGEWGLCGAYWWDLGLMAIGWPGKIASGKTQVGFGMGFLPGLLPEGMLVVLHRGWCWDSVGLAVLLHLATPVVKVGTVNTLAKCQLHVAD